MRGFLIALQFLTRVPVYWPRGITQEELPRSMLYYPAVGLLIGLVLAAVNHAGSAFFPRGLLAAGLLLIPILLTGGLHLDGFADTVDGFYGGRSREAILAIMKDSHIGAMGVIGLIGLLLFKFSLLQSLGPDIMSPALILMPALGRWSMVVVASTTTYARSEGTGQAFVGHISTREWLGATFLTVITALFLMRLLKATILCLMVLLMTFALATLMKRKIGGATGDTLGATNEIIEVLALLIVFMLHPSKL